MDLDFIGRGLISNKARSRGKHFGSRNNCQNLLERGRSRIFKPQKNFQVGKKVLIIYRFPNLPEQQKRDLSVEAGRGIEDRYIIRLVDKIDIIKIEG
jgi:hypothetical protein